MFLRRARLPILSGVAVLILAFGARPAQAQFGPVLSGAGPVNRSMGGASVAAPLDATGAIYWNPAATSAVPNSLDAGVDLLWPQTTLSSRVPAGSLAPGFPPATLSGSDRADNGVFPLPSLAVVYTPEGSPVTYGFGVFAVGGFGVNYSASTTNPILTPQPPGGVGLGAIYSDVEILEIAPTVSFQVTDRLSVGIGPTLSLASLRANPLLLASPDDANGDGFRTYPSGGSDVRETWGGGFQLGAYYKMDGGWQLGTSFKSPLWFETFRFHTVDEKGLPRNDGVNFDFPMIVSAGVGYSGFERWLFAADFRWIDFADADGFRQSGFSPTGAVQGLGFRSIFAVALGVQYQLTDAASLRLGYSYNQNPIPNSQSIFNVASPTILEHTLYVGASYRVSDTLTLSAGYVHGFENAIEGPLVTPSGAVPGSSVRNVLSADVLTVGATVRFGCKPSE